MVDAGKPLIPMEDINSMFSRLEQILTVNGALLEKLTLRIAKWNVVQKIGDVCVDVVCFILFLLIIIIVIIVGSL